MIRPLFFFVCMPVCHRNRSFLLISFLILIFCVCLFFELLWHFVHSFCTLIRVYFKVDDDGASTSTLHCKNWCVLVTIKFDRCAWIYDNILYHTQNTNTRSFMLHNDALVDRIIAHLLDLTSY